MKWSRRDVIKGLGGIPILGTIWWAGAAEGSSNSADEDSQVGCYFYYDVNPLLS